VKPPIIQWKWIGPETPGCHTAPLELLELADVLVVVVALEELLDELLDGPLPELAALELPEVAALELPEVAALELPVVAAVEPPTPVALELTELVAGEPLELVVAALPPAPPPTPAVPCAAPLPQAIDDAAPSTATPARAKNRVGAFVMLRYLRCSSARVGFSRMDFTPKSTR
jgi:hypothetical protein